MKFLDHRKKEDTMLVNVLYHKPQHANGWTDAVDIVYKDVNTKEKFVETIESPNMEIFFLKDEFRDKNYNQNAVPLEQTEVHRVPYKNIEFYIANEAGGYYKTYVDNAIKEKKRALIKNVHKYPYVFGSDYDLENWIRVHWFLFNDSDCDKPISKAYLDIEVDGVDYDGFPLDGVVPINAITVIDEDSSRCFTFLLRNDKNPQIAEFEANIDGFIAELHEAFDETYGKFEYMIYMYDEADELQMIIDLFRLINTLKPDFMLIWNAGFDIPYINGRLEHHFGVDPSTVICHPDFKFKESFYYRDKNNHKVENKGDYFFNSSYTVYSDQMINYAGLRKGQGELRSHALNAVAKVEIGDEKLDYSEDANIKTLPYVNYRKFVMYNIKDVFLQLGIERKTNDIDNIYMRSYANATSLQKIFKQTVFLKNRGYIEFFKQGLIIGNNVNVVHGSEREDPKKKKKFDGAIVADPTLNEATGLKIFGKRSKYIFGNVVDMDFGAMYPSIIRALNIAPNTMIGKLTIGGDTKAALTNAEAALNDDVKIEDNGKVFIDNYLTGNVLNTGTKWFNLPETKEVASHLSTVFNLRMKAPAKIDFKRPEAPSKVTVTIGED